MSGIDYLADTNAIIYLLGGKDCMKPFLSKKLGISVISVMELLSYPGISFEEDAKIRNFISLCEVINLSDSIREKTIQIRRTYRTKLPDSIIAGTAIICNVPLITADTGIFKVEELKVEKISL
jgi:predicted nucleic acid-binding protein